MFSMLLQGELPAIASYNGKEFPIRTDYRIWVEVEGILFEEEGSFLQKLPRLLRLCYAVLPETLEDAVYGMAQFYSGRDEWQLAGGKARSFRPVYSFKQDAHMIYAGFYQQYGIDLLSQQLHWFQFKALLASLGEETLFGRVVHYRSVDLSNIKNKQQRQFYQKMKHLYKLQDYRSEAMGEAELSMAIESLF